MDSQNWNKAGVIGTFFGIIISFVLFYFSLKDVKPKYTIKTTNLITSNVDSSTNKLKVIYNDSIIIKSKVLSTNIVIWNDGELAINKEDIRKEFIISINKNESILDFSITKQSDPDIKNFNLLRINEHSLKLDWNHFDPENAVEVNLLYTCQNNCAILVNGQILREKIKQAKLKPKLTTKQYYLIITINILCVMMIVFMYSSYLENKTWYKLFFILLLLIFLVTFIFPLFQGITPPI